MSEPNEQLETLKEIKSLMERSSRFISLSGLSGISAGIFALIGAWFAYHRFGYRDYYGFYLDSSGNLETRSSVLQFIFIDGAIVLIASLSTMLFFTARRARKNNEKMIDPSARRLIGNLLIPLITGGLLCLVLFLKGDIALIAPCTLIFYGLALVNGSKYSLNDIRYLGFIQIILGLINAWYIGYGLLFWSLGFGLMHILYGSYMWLKYERSN
jgi:hypothetical protein